MKQLIPIILILWIILLVACNEKDMTPPVIKLIGDTSMTIAKDSQFTDPGATASDDIDGDITDQIIINGEVNSGIEGTYFLYYNVEDKAGNPAIEKSRKVKVLIF